MQIDAHPLINIILRGALEENKASGFAPRDLPEDDSIRGVRDLIPALDAIASICVSQPRHQAVATSLTLTKDDKEVVLCVAENDADVSDSTVLFLRALWTELRALSILEKNAQGEHPARDGLIIFTDAVCEATRKIYKTCYAHGRLKLNRRITKRWDEFSQFFKFWFKQEANGPVDLRSKFEGVANALASVKEILGDGDINGELADFVKLMRSTRARCDIILEHVKQLQKWRDDYKKETGQDFRLHHYLRKCYDLDAAISAVISFGLSSRLSHIFERNFVIKRIPCESRTLSYPDTSDRWRAYLEMIFNTAKIVNKWDYDALTVEVGVLKNPSVNPVQLAVSVHSECLLLAHHHRQLIAGAKTQGEVVTPPLNYIGCSKMSCYACTRYFKAYRESSGYGTRFFTRGSHLKHFPPWAIPDLQDPQAEIRVHRALFEHLANDYGEYLEENGIVQSQTASDSSAESSEVSLCSNEKGTTSKEEEVYVSVPTEVFGIDP